MAGVIQQTMRAAGLVLALGAAGWAQAPMAQQAPQPPAMGKPAVAAQAPAQTPPPQPVYPPRPYEMPPVPPTVTYQNGELTIQAQNATLGAILNAVKARTGAQIEVPPDAMNDRVAAQLGPGNPRDVISALLEGSRFGYIVLGSADDPNALSQVILTRNQPGGTTVAGGGSPSSPAASPSPAGPPGPFRGGAARPEIVAGDEDEAETPPPAQPEPTVPTAIAPQQPQQPQVYPPGAPIPNVAPVPVQGGQENPQGQPGQVKTPEQLLQELQRMQQQQQQQQQQKPPQQ